MKKFHFLVVSILSLENFVYAQTDILQPRRSSTALLGEVYLWSDSVGLIGCLSCQDKLGPFSAVGKYLKYFKNSDNGSPCNPDTFGQASLQRAVDNGWAFEGRYTKNPDSALGICNPDGRYRWESACEMLRNFCEGR